MAIKIKLNKDAYSRAITYDNTIRCLSDFYVSINYLRQTNYNFINVALAFLMKVSHYRLKL